MWVQGLENTRTPVPSRPLKSSFVTVDKYRNTGCGWEDYRWTEDTHKSRKGRCYKSWGKRPGVSRLRSGGRTERFSYGDPYSLTVTFGPLRDGRRRTVLPVHRVSRTGVRPVNDNRCLLSCYMMSPDVPMVGGRKRLLLLHFDSRVALWSDSGRCHDRDRDNSRTTTGVCRVKKHTRDYFICVEKGEIPKI